MANELEKIIKKHSEDLQMVVDENVIGDDELNHFIDKLRENGFSHEDLQKISC